MWRQLQGFIIAMCNQNKNGKTDIIYLGGVRNFYYSVFP